jgi:hypothetical protein
MTELHDHSVILVAPDPGRIGAAMHDPVGHDVRTRLFTSTGAPSR